VGEKKPQEGAQTLYNKGLLRRGIIPSPPELNKRGKKGEKKKNGEEGIKRRTLGANTRQFGRKKGRGRKVKKLEKI